MKLSVITTLYRGSRYVEQLISMVERNATLLHRKDPTIEVEYILVNDSPDFPIAIESRELPFECKFITNQHNVGIHQARVNGLKEAKGNYVLFLDQDDRISDHCLLSQLENINQADVIVSNGIRKKKHKSSKLYNRNLALQMTKKKLFYIYGTDLILSPGQCLIKTSAIPKRWKETIMHTNGSDDFYLWLLMFDEKVNFTVNKELLYIHMEEDNHNLSNNREQMAQSYEEMCRLLEENNILSDRERSVLRRRAALKRKCHSADISVTEKIILLIKNMDIFLVTVLYKMAGYY